MLKVVDGPLLQRSSTVLSAPIVGQSVNLNVSIVPELPSGFGGAWIPLPPNERLRYAEAFNDTVLTNNGSMLQNFETDANASLQSVLGDWVGDAPLTDVVRGCPNSSVCETKLRAPTLWPTVCTNHFLSTDYTSNLESVNKLLSNNYAGPLNHDAFMVEMTLMLDEREALNLITGFFDSPTCNGALNYTICTLESAIGEYV